MFHSFPNNEITILLKVYSVVGIAFASRGVEEYKLQWNAVVKTFLADGTSHYEISYERVKQNAPVETLTSTISGNLEVKAIDDYISCFPKINQSGRFFRKLVMKQGKVCQTMQVIGHSTAGNYGKKIANLLGYENFLSYTGHCWRRSSTTFAADAGLSLPQIKVLTGHKSDTVVQGYIDRSKPMQKLVTSAVSLQTAVPVNISTSSSSSSISSTSDDNNNKRQRIDQHPCNITITNSTFNGTFTLFDYK